MYDGNKTRKGEDMKKLFCAAKQCCWRTVDGLCSRNPCPSGNLRTVEELRAENERARKKAAEERIKERMRLAALRACDNKQEVEDEQ